jgi:hypothetical protein
MLFDSLFCVTEPLLKKFQYWQLHFAKAGFIKGVEKITGTIYDDLSSSSSQFRSRLCKENRTGRLNIRREGL